MTPTKTVVVDASVAAKWLFAESGAGEALALLDAAAEDRLIILVPEFLDIEVANALWRRHVLLGEIPIQRVDSLWDRYRLFPLNVYHHAGLVSDALSAACAYGRGLTIYDATYIVCAMHNACGLVTADAGQAKAAREFLAADDVALIR